MLRETARSIASIHSKQPVAGSAPFPAWIRCHRWHQRQRPVPRRQTTSVPRGTCSRMLRCSPIDVFHVEHPGKNPMKPTLQGRCALLPSSSACPCRRLARWQPVQTCGHLAGVPAEIPLTRTSSPRPSSPSAATALRSPGSELRDRRPRHRRRQPAYATCSVPSHPPSAYGRREAAGRAHTRAGDVKLVQVASCSCPWRCLA
jgi:hypothetical protein